MERSLCRAFPGYVRLCTVGSRGESVAAGTRSIWEEAVILLRGATGSGLYVRDQGPLGLSGGSDQCGLSGRVGVPGLSICPWASNPVCRDSKAASGNCRDL